MKLEKKKELSTLILLSGVSWGNYSSNELLVLGTLEWGVIFVSYGTVFKKNFSIHCNLQHTE